MKELVFITKKSKGRRILDDTDVSISFQSGGNNRESIVITFYGGMEFLITNGKTEYIKFAPLGNRVYMAPTDRVDGYKLSATQSKNSKVVKISVGSQPAFAKSLRNCTGSYYLKNDENRNYRYIELKNREDDDD